MSSCTNENSLFWRTKRTRPYTAVISHCTSHRPELHALGRCFDFRFSCFLFSHFGTILYIICSMALTAQCTKIDCPVLVLALNVWSNMYAMQMDEFVFRTYDTYSRTYRYGRSFSTTWTSQFIIKFSQQIHWTIVQNAKWIIFTHGRDRSSCRSMFSRVHSKKERKCPISIQANSSLSFSFFTVFVLFWNFCSMTVAEINPRHRQSIELQTKEQTFV